MRKYIVKRLLLSVLILILVAFIIYALMRCLPTSYVESMAMQRSTAPGSKSYEEWLAQLNAQYGLDKGIIQG
ncbi:MAG: diguanylate cyclase, partial [Clostridiales bacterium]|nr:diguanylate cyclase [Clostridiales bacterium]